MKKLVSLVATLLCATTMWGETTMTIMKEIPDGKNYTMMSEDGKYFISFKDSATITIYNSETDETDHYEDLTYCVGYALGMGNAVSNNGLLVGAMGEKAAVLDIEKKEWTLLPVWYEDAGWNIAQAISGSGEYIVGVISVVKASQGQLKLKPVIWTRQDDGSYGLYENLPYPEKDFTGATPKNILINCISADGSVIAAQMMTQENNCLPLVYRKAEDGTWTYETYEEGLCEPGLEFPEYPEGEPQAPVWYDYMTPEEIAAYEEAYAIWEEEMDKWSRGEISKRPARPFEYEFASEEEVNRYNEAFSKYQEEFDVFFGKLKAYRNFLYANVKSNYYAQNAVWLSNNGKYFVTTCKKDYTVGGSALITIDDKINMHEFGDYMNGYSVTNNGDCFVSGGSMTYIYPGDGSERVSLLQWLMDKGEFKAAEWIEEVGTGVVITNGDGNVFCGVITELDGYRSWFVKLGVETEVNEIITDADADENVKVYDLQGRLIKECRASEAKSGLDRGIYVINNRKVAVK